MEGLDGKVTIFHMAHKGDLRQVQALIQDDPRYGKILLNFIKVYEIESISFANISKIIITIIESIFGNTKRNLLKTPQ